MAELIQRQNGQNYSDNIIGDVLTFNTPSTWSVSSGTGSAIIDDTNFFEGTGSLKLENLGVTDLTVTESTQSTIIDQNGSYQLSLFAYKDDALYQNDVTLNIFKNAVLLDTQTFTIGSTVADDDINAEWVRFISDVEYSLLKNDEITITFTIDSGGRSNVVYLDGIMLCRNNRKNFMPPSYNKPNGDLYSKFTGWGVYQDSTYTTGSPFTASIGVQVNLPNNASVINESQKPIDIGTFYDGSVITGRTGDGLAVSIEFKARPTTAASNPKIKLTVDIGGSIGEIYPFEYLLSKGALVEHFVIYTFVGYTLDTWEANGGTVKVLAINDDIEIYDIRYVLTRTHKAR